MISRDEQTAAADESGAPQAAAVAPAASDPGGSANLDKVRDILFGTQLRELDRRFTRLEERLARETSDLREDVKQRLDALESYVRHEAESLAAQDRAERDQRTDGDAALSRDVRETASAIERRISGLDEQLWKGQRELRQQMLEQHQRLTDDLRRKVDEVLAALSRETGELRSDKADRAMLASLLTEMAMRLTNELAIPGPEEVAGV